MSVNEMIVVWTVLVMLEILQRRFTLNIFKKTIRIKNNFLIKQKLKEKGIFREFEVSEDPGRRYYVPEMK